MHCCRRRPIRQLIHCSDGVRHFGSAQQLWSTEPPRLMGNVVFSCVYLQACVNLHFIKLIRGQCGGNVWSLKSPEHLQLWTSQTLLDQNLQHAHHQISDYEKTLFKYLTVTRWRSQNKKVQIFQNVKIFSSWTKDCGTTTLSVTSCEKNTSQHFVTTE